MSETILAVLNGMFEGLNRGLDKRREYAIQDKKLELEERAVGTRGEVARYQAESALSQMEKRHDDVKLGQAELALKTELGIKGAKTKETAVTGGLKIAEGKLKLAQEVAGRRAEESGTKSVLETSNALARIEHQMSEKEKVIFKISNDLREAEEDLASNIKKNRPLADNQIIQEEIKLHKKGLEEALTSKEILKQQRDKIIPPSSDANTINLLSNVEQNILSSIGAASTKEEFIKLVQELQKTVSEKHKAFPAVAEIIRKKKATFKGK